MKSTLKRELKACETVKKEAIKVSSEWGALSLAAGGMGSLQKRPPWHKLDEFVLCSGQHRFRLRETACWCEAFGLKPVCNAVIWSEEAV